MHEVLGASRCLSSRSVRSRMRLGPPAIGGGGIHEMLHLLSNAALGTAPSSLRSKGHALTPVLISEHGVPHDWLRQSATSTLDCQAATALSAP